MRNSQDHRQEPSTVVKFMTKTGPSYMNSRNNVNFEPISFSVPCKPNLKREGKQNIIQNDFSSTNAS